MGHCGGAAEGRSATWATQDRNLLFNVNCIEERELFSSSSTGALRFNKCYEEVLIHKGAYTYSFDPADYEQRESSIRKVPISSAQLNQNNGTIRRVQISLKRVKRDLIVSKEAQYWDNP